MSTPEVSNVNLTPSAPLETNISKEHEYTDVVILQGTSCSKPLDAILKDYMPGVGRADLVKIEVKIVTTASAQKVCIGFANVNSSLTAEQAAMKMSGLYFVSNSYSAGNEITRVLIPEDTLSRQIRPNSADLMMMNFLLSATDGVKIAVHFFIKVHGMRTQYGDFPAA